MKKILSIILITACLACGCSSASGTGKNTSKSTASKPESIDFFAMDTTIKFSAYGDKKVLKGAKKVLTDFEKKVSVTDSGSEIYHINQNVHTYRFLYTERFFRAAFQFLHTFHGFRPYTQGSTSLCSPIRDLFNDTAEFT